MRYSTADLFLSIIIGCLLFIIATRYSTASFFVLFLVLEQTNLYFHLPKCRHVVIWYQMLSCFFSHPVTVPFRAPCTGGYAPTSWTGVDYISSSCLFWWDAAVVDKHPLRHLILLCWYQTNYNTGWQSMATNSVVQTLYQRASVCAYYLL